MEVFGSNKRKKNFSEKNRSFWKLNEKKKHFKKLMLEISETWTLCLLKTCVYWRNLVVVIQNGLERKKFFFQSKKQKMKNKLIILLSEEQFLFENDLLRTHKLYWCFFFSFKICFLPNILILVKNRNFWPFKPSSQIHIKLLSKIKKMYFN